MLPLLAIGFGMAGMAGAYLVAVLWQNIDPGAFFDRIKDLVQPSDLRMCEIKALVFGVIISSLACYLGLGVTGGAEGGGRATTRTVVFTIVSLLTVDLMFNAVFYVFGL